MRVTTDRPPTARLPGAGAPESATQQIEDRPVPGLWVALAMLVVAAIVLAVLVLTSGVLAG